jgi:hypothetical protein
VSSLKYLLPADQDSLAGIRGRPFARRTSGRPDRALRTLYGARWLWESREPSAVTDEETPIEDELS